MYLLGRHDSWSKEFSEKVKARRRNVRVIRTTSIEPYLKDYSFFALSPLYVHAGVGYSMPDQFELEAGSQDRLIIDYQRTVIGGLKKWGHFVEGIRNKVYEDFCHYLSTVMFVSVPKNVVWQIRAQDINIEGTDAQVVIDPKRLPVRLRVFLPDGNRGRMFIKSGYPAKLWWDRPNATIIEAATAILRCHGRIEDEG